MSSPSHLPSRTRTLVRSGVHLQRGISLLQLMVILASLIALVVGLSYKTSDFFAKSQALDSDAQLRLADRQLRQYIVANGRLPCPDLTGDGVAAATCTSSQQKGYLPYITLGMVEKNYVYGEVPMLYGVYNDGTINLASTAQVFFPSYKETDNSGVNVTADRGVFDFCYSLGLLKAKSIDTNGLNVNGLYNAVYALATPGQGNRDGASAGWASGPTVNAQYDGLNATHASRFELPQAPVSPSYDDRTHFRAAADMHDYLRCEAMNSSISLLAEAVTIQKEVEDFADGNSEDATKGLVMNAVGIAIATWELVQTVGAIAEAAEQIGIAAGLLATVTATCPLPPWVTCALIPVYATSLSSASVGQGLAIGAAVAAGVGLGLNITATVLYADLKGRTSTTPTEPVQSISGISAGRLLELKNAYSASKAAAQTAYAAVPTPAPDAVALNNAQLGAAATLTTNINGVVDNSLKTVLANNLNGSSLTCTSGSVACLAAGYTERQVPSKDGSGNFILDANKKPVMTTIYTKDGLSTTFAPGVKPALDNYYEALAQQGASNQLPNTTGNQALTDANSALAAAPVIDPATALAAKNTLVNQYTSLLAAVKAFDAKNLLYQQAAALAAARLSDYNYAVDLRNRSAYCSVNFNTDASCRVPNAYYTNRPRQDGKDPYIYGYAQVDWNNTWISQNEPATTSTSIAAALVNYNDAVAAKSDAFDNRSPTLSTLRTQMGNGSWDYNEATTLCGGGSTSTSSCSALVNQFPVYLAAYDSYKDAAAYLKLKNAADNAAASAWADRNGFKTALCATKSPSVTWLGSTSRSSENPSAWDSSEMLPGATWSGSGTAIATNVGVTGLSCTGSASARDNSTDSAAARAAEKAKYCPGGSAPDTALCALYSSSPAKSSIQGAKAIVDALIQKGIVR